MKSSFYYDGHHLEVADKIKRRINASPDFLSPHTAHSTSAVGDAIESFISDHFDEFLQDWCTEYSNDFGRRAMADVAFTDKEILKIKDRIGSFDAVKTYWESREDIWSEPAAAPGQQ